MEKKASGSFRRGESGRFRTAEESKRKVWKWRRKQEVDF